MSSEPLASISALLASACPFSHPPRFVLLAQESAEFILTASPLFLFLHSFPATPRFLLDAARKPGAWTPPPPACLRESLWMPNGHRTRYLFAKLNVKPPIESYIHVTYCKTSCAVVQSNRYTTEPVTKSGAEYPGRVGCSLVITYAPLLLFCIMIWRACMHSILRRTAHSRLDRVYLCTCRIAR